MVSEMNNNHSQAVHNMKNVRLIISVTVLVGIAGCSTPTPNSTISHQSDVADVATTIEDAKQLYEMGKMNAAEEKLQSVLAIEPNNRVARYYLALVKEAQGRKAAVERRSPKFWGYYPTDPPKPIYQ
jgi:Tfp pilus assembly protein PilF